MRKLSKCLACLSAAAMLASTNLPYLNGMLSDVYAEDIVKAQN